MCHFEAESSTKSAVKNGWDERVFNLPGEGRGGGSTQKKKKKADRRHGNKVTPSTTNKTPQRWLM